MVQILLHSKGRIVRYLIAVFLLLSIVFFGFSLLTQYSTDSLKGPLLLQREAYFVETVGELVIARLSRIVSDLVFIKDSFRSLAVGGTNRDALQAVATQWLSFSNAHRLYDQIRFLDTEGNEVLRVDYTMAGGAVIPDVKLQNKKDRYYFKDSISLPDRHIYISCMDLNIENGLIQTPRKPVIRLATPVYNHANQLMGVIVLNYLANDVLNLINSFTPNAIGTVSLLNADGYWLLNSGTPWMDWGFMYEDMVDVCFAKQNPVEWQAMQQNQSGHLITDNGVFVYSRVLTADAFSLRYKGYPVILGSGDWFMQTQIPLDSDDGRVIHNTVENMVKSSLGSQYYVYLMILFISFVIALLMTIARSERESIRFFSEFDTMTGALNRRAGLKLLNDRYIANPDRRCQISLCFIDINSLKEVNDTLGHNSGDALICTVADTIRQSIRESDLLIRLGGDEFLIVFDGLGQAEAEAVWERIHEGFETVNRTEGRPYIVSVSHGIETCRCSESESFEKVLNGADEKMYAEKRRLKEILNVIRDGPQAAGGAEPDGPQAAGGANGDTGSGSQTEIFP